MAEECGPAPAGEVEWAVSKKTDDGRWVGLPAVVRARSWFDARKQASVALGVAPESVDVVLREQP